MIKSFVIRSLATGNIGLTLFKTETVENHTLSSATQS